jgi:hypothetical protein
MEPSATVFYDTGEGSCPEDTILYWRSTLID